MLKEADERAKKAEVNHIVKHKLSDASSLALNSSSFDSCRSERLFLHLQDPSQVLAEMVRVTKPEGWIVVVDTDAATVSFDTVETDIERRLLRFRAEQLLNNGYAGRQLYRLFRQCDLVDISVEMFPLFINKYATARYIAGLDETEKEAIKMGIITREELIRWHQDLESSAKKQVFFASASVVMVVARKP
jgi:ubiquinone/menaquinone biosynthesis C-methylase UbiE